jgi:hypothetical protein
MPSASSGHVRLGFTLLGLAVGIVVAANVTRFLEALLYEVAPTDPATFAGIALVVLAVAAPAAWLPARRPLAVSAAAELRRSLS